MPLLLLPSSILGKVACLVTYGGWGNCWLLSSVPQAQPDLFPRIPDQPLCIPLPCKVIHQATTIYIVYSLPIQNTTSTAYPTYPTAHCVNPYLARFNTRPGHCYVMRPPNTSDCPNCCPALHLSMVEARKLPPKYHLSPVLPSDDEQAGSIFVGYTHKCFSIDNSVQTSKHVLIT